MIDTHCHLTYEPLATQIQSVLTRCATAGVDGMITIGTSPDESVLAVKLAEQHAAAGVFAAVGLHPLYATENDDKNAILAPLRVLLNHPRVVAIGEMGLDKFHNEPPIAWQQKSFEWQLELAAENDLPIIIHNRMATDMTLSVLRSSGLPGARFVFHCFTGSAAELDAILDFGAMVGFTGIVTFKSAAELAQASLRVPLERMFVETDSPYLTPEPHRKVRPNDPSYVPLVAKFLAASRGMSEQDFIAQVDRNAKKFFPKMTLAK